MTEKVDPKFEGIFDNLWKNETPAEEPKGEEPKSDFFQDLIKKMETEVLKTCTGCGEEFKGQPETELCIGCEYLERNPELKPKRWTWTKIENQWGVIATWPDKDPRPQPGDRVTVHRKDGNTSEAILREHADTRGTPAGEIKVIFYIQG